MRLGLASLPLLVLLCPDLTSSVEGRLRARRAMNNKRNSMNTKNKNTDVLYQKPKDLIPAEEEDNLFDIQVQVQVEQLPRIRIKAKQRVRVPRKLDGDEEEQGVELEGFGGTPAADVLPLQLCEGDCDEDSDCDVGLVCFQREPQMAVPGCIGGEEENSKTDFCVPDPEAQLTRSPGLNSNSTSSSPLLATPAPAPQADVPTTAPSMTKATASPTVAVGVTPIATPPTLDAATSDTLIDDITIDNDNDPPQPTIILTDEFDLSTASPTATAATPQVEIDVVGNNGSPSDAYPLGLCQGDCDDDSDCANGLICFQRGPNEPVPGCVGDDSSRNDYCIPDPLAVPTLAPSTSSSPSSSPTKLEPTSSMEPSTFPSTSPNPSSTPSDVPSDVPSDFPSMIPTITPMPSISSVPTATPTGAPTALPREGVQLKLYWEEGYTWQDETVERKWCMISNYRGFPGTGKCWHGLVTEPCHADMVYVARCDSDNRQMFSVYPMPGGKQFQIGLYKDNLCLERLEYSVVLRQCDYMNPLQRFWMPRGALSQKRFELSPITLANHCLTQAHHPKSGEVVELHKCSRARHPEHQSSFWNVYPEEEQHWT